MKKIVTAFFLFILLMLATYNVQAVELTNINISTNKNNIKSGEEIELNIEFGDMLGAYKFSIAYDKNLVEFVSVEGGDATDNGTTIDVEYLDTTNNANPRENMKIIFKGKLGITTSNPTNFAITAENLVKADSSIVYDDITVPIIKNFIVEPDYEEYNIELKYTGDIVKQEEKDMSIVITSSMAKPYEHARIILEVTKPEGGNVQLLGVDQAGLTHDLIQSGWGDASGYPIGGENIRKQLDLKGIFSTAGEYSITVKIIDRDDSDAIISQKTFPISVKEIISIDNDFENNNNDNIGQISNSIVKNETNTTTNTAQENKLLRTGSNGIVKMIIFTLIIIIGYVYLESKRNKQ